MQTRQGQTPILYRGSPALLYCLSWFDLAVKKYFHKNLELARI